MHIPVGKVHKELLKHQDLGFKKSLIHGLWKLETYTKGSITVYLHIYSHPLLPGLWDRVMDFVDQLSYMLAWGRQGLVMRWS